MLVLVSQAFLNSRYISEVEVAEMIQSLGARGLRVYPVLLRKCDWKTRAWLAGTQAQPRDGKTVEDNYKTRAARTACSSPSSKTCARSGSPSARRAAQV